MASTNIDWCDKVWNPVTGCTKISPGCDNCYALEITKRFKNSFPNGFKLTLHPNRLTQPTTWRKPQKIFVNSMSDLFHKDVPDEFILKVFSVIRKTERHTFQLLTKRPERMVGFMSRLFAYGSKLVLADWPAKNDLIIPNLWLGVSVENTKTSKRIDILREIPGAAVKFISFEPLLEDIDKLCLNDIDWVIVGGESGNNHRLMQEEWVMNIKQVADKNGVAFFFKQWGGKTPKAGGRLLDGKEWNQFPS